MGDVTRSTPPDQDDEDLVLPLERPRVFSDDEDDEPILTADPVQPPSELSTNSKCCGVDVVSSYLRDMVPKVIAGGGHVLNDLCASLWYTYLLIYFQQVVGTSKNYGGGLLLLGQVVDAVATPIVGYETDKFVQCWLCRSYGRCKSWHLIGTLLVMGSFPFIFSPCIGCVGVTEDWIKFIYYGPFIAIFQTGWAATQISHLALIPKLSKDELVRTELLAIRYGFTILANMIVFVLMIEFLGLNTSRNRKGIGPSDANTFMDVALIAVGIGAFFILIFHFFVREEKDPALEWAKNSAGLSGEIEEGEFDERDLSDRGIGARNRSPDALIGNNTDGEALLATEEEDSQVEPEVNFVLTRGGSEDNISLLGCSSQIRSLSTVKLNLGKPHMSVKDWLILPQFYIVALVYMLTRLCVNITQVFMPLYLEISLHESKKSVATIPLTMYVSGFIAALMIKVINKHLGRQLAYTLGALLSITGSLAILIIQGECFIYRHWIYIAACFIGGGASAILVTSLSITADMIGNNVENGAFVYGCMSFFDKLGCGLAVVFIEHISPSKEENLEKFYTYVVGFSCGGFPLLGVFGMILLTLIICRQIRSQSSRFRHDHRA